MLSSDVILTRLHAAAPSLRPWIAGEEAKVRAATARGVRSTRTASLTIFRMGLGRDSLAMLGLLLEGGLLANGQRIMPDDVDAVVFTDPGMEWANTYALIPKVSALCAEHGLRFIVQAKAPEEEQRAWTAYRTVGSTENAPWREARPGESIESNGILAVLQRDKHGP